MLIAQKYFENKKNEIKIQTHLQFYHWQLLISGTIPRAFIYVYVRFSFVLFLFLQFCSCYFVQWKGDIFNPYNEIRKQWMESLRIKTWWRQDFPPFTFSLSLWRKKERRQEVSLTVCPRSAPVWGLGAHTPRGETGACGRGICSTAISRQHVWKLPDLKTKQAVGTGCELFAQTGLAGCLASWGSTQPRCVNPPHIPAVLTHAVLTHPGCSQGTWIGEQYRGCRPPAGNSRLAPFRCVKSKLLLFDIKYDCKGQQVEQGH